MGTYFASALMYSGKSITIGLAEILIAGVILAIHLFIGSI